MKLDSAAVRYNRCNICKKKFTVKIATNPIWFTGKSQNFAHT